MKIFKKLKFETNLLVILTILVVCAGTIAVLLYYPLKGYIGSRAATITVCASGCDYTSIQEAVNNAGDGDTINVQAGTYTEGVTFFGGGATSLTLQGAGIGQTIWQNSNGIINIWGTDRNIVIDGFTLDVVGASGFANAISTGGGGHSSTYLRFSNNLITSSDGSGARGIWLQGGYTGGEVDIYNNIISNLSCIKDDSGSFSDVDIYNNVFYNCNTTAIYLANSAVGVNYNLYNNIIHTAVNGLSYDGSEIISHTYNDYYNISGTILSGEGLTLDATEMTTDPRLAAFTGSNAFKLLSNSSLIDAGLGGVDIGAYPDGGNYVDPNRYVDASGDNGHGGASAGDAWQTITYALSQLNGLTGYVINVAAGTYNEALGEDFTGGWNVVGITLSGAGANNTDIVGPGGSTSDIINLSNGATLQNFRISGGGSGGDKRMIRLTSGNATISHNYFEGGQTADEAIKVEGGTATITNNVLANFSSGCVAVSPNGVNSSAVINNNTFDSCGSGNAVAISAQNNGDYTASFTSQDNIINSTNCFAVNNGATGTSAYNDTYCSNTRYSDGMSEGTGDIFAQPAYVQTNNYALDTYFVQKDYSFANRGSSTDSYRGARAYSGTATTTIYIDDDGATYPSADAATIGAVINSAATNYTMMVAPGTYNENDINVVTSGFTLRGNSPADTIINFQDQSNGLTLNGSAITIKNISITHSTSVNGVILLSGNNNTIQDCYFYDNTITQSGGGAYAVLNLNDNSSGATILRNAFYNNDAKIVINVSPGASGSVVNNVFSHNTLTEAVITDNTDQTTTVKNNIIYHNTSIGLNGSLTNTYNLLYDNATNYSGGASAGTGDIFRDPFFTNQNNPQTDHFTLLAYSPAIDAGDPSSECSLEPGSGTCRINQGIHGNTIYAVGREYQNPINVNAITGDDRNDGTTPSTAKATIGGCLNNLPVNDGGGTCLVAAGTYNEDILFRGGMNNISLIGADASTTIIQGTGNSDVINLNGHDSITIANFTIQNGQNGVNLIGTTNITLHDNIIQNNGTSQVEGVYPYYGLRLNGAGSTVSYNNIISGNGNGLGLLWGGGNTFTNDIISGSLSSYNLVYNTAGNNTFINVDYGYDPLVDSSYADHTSLGSSTGTLTVNYKVIANVGLPNAAVTFTDSENNIRATAVTDENGATTAQTLPAYSFTNGDIGNLNPYRVSVELVDYTPASSSLVLDERNEQIAFVLDPAGSRLYFPRITSPTITKPVTITPSPVASTPTVPETPSGATEITEAPAEPTTTQEEVSERIEQPERELAETPSSLAGVGEAIKKAIPPTPEEVKEKNKAKLIKENQAATVYVINLETKIKQVIPDEKIFNDRGYSWNDVQIVAAQELQNYELAKPVLYPVGSLVKFFSDPAVYEVVSESVIKHIPNETVFEEKYGKEGWEKIKTESDSLMALYEVAE